MMEYIALGLIAGNPKCEGLRNMLDGRNLAQLTTLEYVCSAAIDKSIDAGLHYKEVYSEANKAAINMCNQFVKNERPFITAARRAERINQASQTLLHP
jgi:hypothetical protein